MARISESIFCMKITPLMVLRERAEARAYLWAHGEFTFIEAVNPLFRYAVQSGLSERFGEQYISNMIDGIFIVVGERYENNEPIFRDETNGERSVQVPSAPGNSERDADAGPET